MVSKIDFLPPLQTNEFIPPITRWTTWGGIFILGVLSLAIPVAAVAKYKVTVKGQAVVRPTGELRIVQAATEGQVMQIYVKENQEVKKGDTVATIDDSRLQTKKSQLQTNIQQAKLQLVQINAQIHALNSQINAENDRINRTIASAQAGLSGREREYQDKKITTVSELQEADANIKMANKELQAGIAQLKSTQANLRASQAAWGAAKSKQKRYQSVATQGALSQDQLEEAVAIAQQQEQAVAVQTAAVEVQKQTIERLQQAVAAAVAKRQRAIAALNPSNAEVAIATERIAQEKASGESSKATLEKERQALVKQRIETEKQLERDTSDLGQIELDLKQTTITATTDGIVSQLNLRNPGQTVRPGEEVLQIVPHYAPQVIKAAIASEDKNKLKIGQKVQMRVSACPYPDYGTLKGQVQAISPDAITPQKNSNNTSAANTSARSQVATTGSYYEVTIEPETLVLGKGKNQCHIQLGMEGRADIISREETVLQFFLRKARLIADL
ncbi:HlyD family efflux transporter periplasmic adaptor subunit [Nostoc sp. FACHB-152]|uniref:HlyD family efflux transporter periplasmic adaptor subunit n=1 Tax=unclassified Nostoc TaxID=2593658 RepID=UPI0016821771|nr:MULTISPECIES: HlyD family efflux transporter periplasmic adaptor subunit [unclassified Nostoc]MBD2449675.1 HlyD family efflux transporter periplasmic adaptor subunit [Nostoc sp. FACHB-152]MBD2469661.1 HlyD family efflux transporter periplasmic adaptor subunit [Nostoc sp. FACHB-145]